MRSTQCLCRYPNPLASRRIQAAASDYCLNNVLPPFRLAFRRLLDPYRFRFPELLRRCSPRKERRTAARALQHGPLSAANGLIGHSEPTRRLHSTDTIDDVAVCTFRTSRDAEGEASLVNCRPCFPK